MKKKKNGLKNSTKNDNIGSINNKGDKSNIISKILEVNNLKRSNTNISGGFQEKNETNINLLLNEYNQKGDFTFIHINTSLNKYENDKIKSIQNFDDYKIIINIICDDDSLDSSINLSKIFKIIKLSLYNSNIKNKFLIFIYFQHFTYETSFKTLFPGLKFYYIENSSSSDFYFSFGNFISDNKINILLFYKEASSSIEIYKFFYTQLLPDLINFKSKENNKTVLIVNWPNGKILKNNNKKSCNNNISNIFKNVINICGTKNMILIPEIDFLPNKNDLLFGYLNKFCLNNDKIRTNLYWYVMSGYPIDHRFFFINMNYELFTVLKDYYQNEKIKIYSNEYYHDYHLVLYLRKNMKHIEIEKILDIIVDYSDLPWNLMNYFHDLILRRGSEYANTYSLFDYFTSFKNLDCKKFFQKFVLIFKLLNNIIQFFWLGIIFLIAYAVFNDTFGTKDNKIDYFCSLGYVIMTIILLSISLIYVKNDPKIKYNKIDRNNKLNREGYKIIFVLYLIHCLYFYFFIICSIIALIHIKQGKYSDITDSEIYIFSTDFFIILLIINIFLYAIPTFFNISNISSKGFFYYIFFHLPNLMAFFHYPYLFTCIKTINSREKKIESLYVIFYVILNGLVTVICLVFDTTRQRRMNFLCIMAIIISVLNVAKFIINIIGICSIKNFRKKYLKHFEQENEEFIINENKEESFNNNKEMNSTNENLMDSNYNFNNNKNELKEIQNEFLDIDNNRNIAKKDCKSNSSEKITYINNNLNIIKGQNIENINKISKSSYMLKIHNYPMDSIDENLEVNYKQEKLKNNENIISQLKDNNQNEIQDQEQDFPNDNIAKSFSVENSDIT